jgi:hypothetical protein
MKDYIFSDPSESIEVVVFRTDAIGSANNFTVHQITGLEEVPWDQQKKAGLLAFGKRETTKQALMTYAEDNQLNLVEQDSTGDNSTTLVSFASDNDTDSW